MATSVENAALQNTERWRQRYYDSLAELENKERQWAKLESLLRRSISRLTLLADGIDPGLDHQLEKLRNIIRDERDDARIKSMIDSISAAAERVERQRSRDANTSTDAVELLADLVDELPFPRGMGRRIKGFKKQLSAAHTAGDIPSLIKGFTALLTETLTLTASEGRSATAEARQVDPAVPEDKGLFGKRRAKPTAKPGDGQTRPSAIDGGAELPETVLGGIGEVLLRFLHRLKVPDQLHADLKLLKHRVTAASRYAEYQVLADAIADLIAEIGTGGEARDAVVPAPPAPRQVLVQLLDSLSLPAELSDKVDALKEKLERNQAEDDLNPALTSIASLVAEVRNRAQRERREIERFLKQLTRRLQDLDRHLEGADNARAESLASRHQLQDAVHTQVSKIETTVKDAADLEPLKQAVQTRVEAIRAHMDQYRRTEEQRNRQMEERIQALTSRLRSLEGEADGLRKNILQARTKALQDPLTGMPNRMAYEERVAQEFTRWKRYHSPLIMVLWDLDHFKRINDSYGHTAGDKVLSTVGRLFAGQHRATDFTARYGGEEFISLLPETTLETALPVVEKSRVMIENSGFHHGNIAVPITISCGVAQFHEGDTPETVFERADRAMYRAKQNGRNQCQTEAGS